MCSVGRHCCLFCEITKENMKIKLVKEEDADYVHLHHFKKITTNLISLVIILKMLKTIIMSLRRQCLMYQLIRYFAYLCFQIKISLRAAPNSSHHFTKREGTGVRFQGFKFKQNHSLSKKPS